MKPEILTIDEAAARRGVSRSRIVQYLADGRLKSVRAAPPVMIDARDIDKMLPALAGCPRKKSTDAT